MKNNYLCPHCKGYLNVGDSIIFSAKTKDKKAGLILLHPEIGNYSATKHPSFEFKEGEHADFFCPICQKSLKASKIHDNLAMVIMTDQVNNEFVILFSEIFGEKCTYKIKDKKVEAFGKDSSQYINFFNLSSLK